MSKFKDTKVNGNGNQFGDNNTLSHVTNHHHHNDGGGSTRNNKKEEDALGVSLGLLFGVAALVWLFFSHLDQIYFYLQIITLSSAIPAIAAVLVMHARQELDNIDMARFGGSVLLMVGLFGLLVLADNHASREIAAFAQQVGVMDFYQGLTEHGKELAVMNFVAALLLGVAAVCAHLGGFRQLIYALADANQTGFWYRLYQRTPGMGMRVTGSLAVVFASIAGAALTGYLPSSM